MAGLYYKIWVDAIITERSKKAEGRNWKLYTIIPISLLQGANLFTFFYWMKTFVNRNLPLFFPVSVFNARLINDFIAIIVTLFFPFVILNYLLIFSYDRYEQLIARYRSMCAKYYRKYIWITLGLVIVPIIIKKMFF